MESPVIACSLDAGNLKERLGWIASLNARSLKSSRLEGLTLTLEYEPGAIEDVRKMVAAEQACCSFFSFEVSQRSDRVVLTIHAPEAAREAAEALFEPFASVSQTLPVTKTCGCTDQCGA